MPWTVPISMHTRTGLELQTRTFMKKEHSVLALDFKNKNVLFWQNGQLITNRVGIHLRTDIEPDAVRRTLLLRDALIQYKRSLVSR